MNAKVGERGQVTIPKRLRDRLGIRPGQVLELEARGVEVVLRKPTAPQPVRALRGLLPRMDVDAAVDELRGPGWTPGLDGEE